MNKYPSLPVGWTDCWSASALRICWKKYSAICMNDMTCAYGDGAKQRHDADTGLKSFLIYELSSFKESHLHTPNQH